MSSRSRQPVQLAAALLEADDADASFLDLTLKDELIANAPDPSITCLRVFHTTRKADPESLVQQREVVQLNGPDPVKQAYDYLRSLSDKYQTRHPIETIRTNFRHSAGPQVMCSTRRLWPPDSSGCTDRYIVAGLSIAELRKLNDLVRDWMFGYDSDDWRYRGVRESIVRLLEDADTGAADAADMDSEAKDALMSVLAPRIRVTRSFLIPGDEDETPEPQSEWVDEEGVPMAVDEFDEDGATIVSKTVDFLWNEGAVHPSALPHFHPGVWYSTEWSTVNYRTGEEEEKHYHLVDFTPEQEEAVYTTLMAAKRASRRPRLAAESVVEQLLESGDLGDEDALDLILKDEVLNYDPENVPYFYWYTIAPGRTGAAHYNLGYTREEALKHAAFTILRTNARFRSHGHLADKDLAEGEFVLPDRGDVRTIIKMRRFTPEEMRHLVDLANNNGNFMESSDADLSGADAFFKDALMAHEWPPVHAEMRSYFDRHLGATFNSIRVTVGGVPEVALVSRGDPSMLLVYAKSALVHAGKFPMEESDMRLDTACRELCIPFTYTSTTVKSKKALKF